MASILTGVEPGVRETERRSQVFQATHVFDTDSQSWKRDSFMNRSFISFSFGGKWIEDWGLIATTKGNRLQRAVSAPFADIISDYDILDGQFYWGTRYTNNMIEFTLATDGITQQQLDDFKYWFAGGKTRELILSEHPNRAIMARVNAAPTAQVLPFEEKTKVKLGNDWYETSTTLYKGEIVLSFVMAEPYWYSKVNCFTYQDDDGNWHVDQWNDAQGKEVSVYSDKDAIKVVLEDGIPMGTMTLNNQNTVLGNNISYSTDGPTGSKLGSPKSAGTGHDASGDGTNTEYAEADFGHADFNISYRNETEPSFASTGEVDFYYPGTAPSCPKISFSLTPVIDSSTYYIISPINRYTDTSDTPYNSITIQSTEQKKLNFSLPGAWIGYNQAIETFTTIGNNISFIELRKTIRDTIKHKAARAWAIHSIDSVSTSLTAVTSASNLASIMTEMKKFLIDSDSGNCYPSDFTIDCKSGRATAVMRYNTINDSNESEKQENEEDAGDMIKSNYLKIEERNYLDEDGMIGKWDDNPTYCHKLTHNVVNGLENFIFNFNYMYY